MGRLRGGQSVENISEWLGGALPDGSNAMPFPRQSDSKVDAEPNLTTLTGFAGGSYNLTASGLDVPGLGGASTAPQLGQAQPWQFATQQQGQVDSGRSHPISMNWAGDLGAPPQSRVGFWGENLTRNAMADSMPRFRGLEQVLSPLNEPEMKSPTGTWTSITNDINLVQHLLALYFCWEYPTFASLSKEHFLRDFQDGRHRYCSPILINALLALGCRFSTQPMTRANPDDPYSSGDHFFKESQRLFYQETDHHSLTTIQALGIMSIREASCGRDSESWYFAGQSIRLAIEMGLHRVHDEGDEDELAVQSATFWGAFALDQ